MKCHTIVGSPLYLISTGNLHSFLVGPGLPIYAYTDADSLFIKNTSFLLSYFMTLFCSTSIGQIGTTSPTSQQTKK